MFKLFFTLPKKTFQILQFCKIFNDQVLGRHDTQQDDIQHNDI
jgi:hypothetical protein